MRAHQFLAETVYCMEQPSIDLLLSLLTDRYIKFIFVEKEDVSADVFAEKLLDYFRMVEMKTFRNFDDCISVYMSGLDSIVEPRVARFPLENNGEEGQELTRARKYYERFDIYKSKRGNTVDDLIDYSRIMLCLYESIVENDLHPIDNFDYDLDSIDPVAIIESMLSEEKRGLLSRSASKRFDTRETLEMGTCTVVITSILLAAIAPVENKGVDDHE